MKPCLQIDNLHLATKPGRGAPEKLILRGVNLSIMPGEIHALVGESGAGKSMVSRTLLGITPAGVRVRDGRIDFLGMDWLGMSGERRRRHLGSDLALIPQDPLTALNPARTIGAQVGDVLRLHKAVPAEALPARVLALLESVQLRNVDTVVRQYPHELSGGMRQRVLIAMAFACKPRLIIADEPTTALDVTVQRDILRLLRALQRDEGAAVLFITHNLGIVAKLCDKVSVIHSGRIVEAGSARQIIEAPATPYTRSLFAATPRYDRPVAALRPIGTAILERLDGAARDYDTAWFAARRTA